MAIQAAFAEAGTVLSFDPDDVQRTLRRAWSLATARQWTASNPAAGQCNVTALLVHELFGGDLLKTPLPAGDHFYNRIEGERYDFTASQFDQPIAYLDLPASRADAERGATAHELAELRTAFRLHSTKSG
ncbi:YunG family protein [Bradyrhizobium japonicum]|uniref:YunG family protein n=1 Tax=Bradyrhizobium japonicum TaxID=375 RepID=UPI000403F372